MTAQPAAPARKRGFTVVEMITVLVILGILALVVVSRVGTTSSARLASRTGDMVAKVRYAQIRAIKSGTPWGVRCDGTNLWLFHGTDATDPTLRERFPGEQDLNIPLASKDMTLSAFTLIFDGYGIPYVAYTDFVNNTKVDDSLNQVQLTVGMPGLAETRSIGVTPETGLVS